MSYCVSHLLVQGHKQIHVIMASLEQRLCTQLPITQADATTASSLPPNSSHFLHVPTPSSLEAPAVQPSECCRDTNTFHSLRQHHQHHKHTTKDSNTTTTITSHRYNLSLQHQLSTPDSCGVRQDMLVLGIAHTTDTPRINSIHQHTRTCNAMRLSERTHFQRGFRSQGIYTCGLAWTSHMLPSTVMQPSTSSPLLPALLPPAAASAWCCSTSSAATAASAHCHNRAAAEAFFQAIGSFT